MATKVQVGKLQVSVTEAVKVNGVEHVYNNADSFGVDNKRICVSGTSGGGWIIMGACLLLVKEDK